MKKALACIIILASLIFCDSLYATSMLPIIFAESEKASEVVAEVEVVKIEPIEYNENGTIWYEHYATVKLLKIIKGNLSGDYAVIVFFTEADGYRNNGTSKGNYDAKFVVGEKGTVYLKILYSGGMHSPADIRQGFQKK